MPSTARWLLGRLTPRSAISIVSLTFVVLYLVVHFFVQDIQLVSLKPELNDGSGMLADRALLLKENLNCITDVENPFTGEFVYEEEQFAPDETANSVDVAVLTTQEPVESVPVQPSGLYSASSAIKPDPAPNYVAMLSRTADCQWAEEVAEIQEGAQIKVGQTLNIAAGLIEIVFGCGATAIIEGPAVLELESSKCSALRSGKLTANVPDDVEGFTIHTPTAQLVSLCRKQSEGVAKLTAFADCQWADGNAASIEGACLKPGQKVKLTDGLVEITFGCGAKVILEGPADLEIESTMTATLHNGRMTADVPDELEGFKIRTPVAEILSLPVNASATENSALESPE